MSLFDIIGPVMVGPSSSHTAGVVRIGNVVKQILGNIPAKATVEFHGSFATTYQGHGSDRAIVAGMLGMSTEDERIRNSLALARDSGMEVDLKAVHQSDGHPNKLVVNAESRTGETLHLVGYSVGGGNILIVRINAIAVEFTGKCNTLIVGHKDTPGVIARVTRALADRGINIASMKVYRALRGGDAIMIIETDQDIDRQLVCGLEQQSGVFSVTSLPSLF